MSYYARFETIADYMFRFDTRIYLGKHSADEDGECVGAIIGKNPGSAKPTQFGVLASLNLDGDKMLPSVRNRFLSAYQQAGKVIPENAFVQVWNLFYHCNPDLGAACSAMSRLNDLPLCPSESGKQKVVWFAWGGSDNRLNPFKQRFLSDSQCGFYYNHQSGMIVSRSPCAADFAKHPQGLPALPIVNHLAGLL
jgi:hypothetical protein